MDGLQHKAAGRSGHRLITRSTSCPAQMTRLIMQT